MSRKNSHTKLEQALESMLVQFGYRGVKGNRPIICTGGLSALEEAFDAMGWDDPHYLPEEGYTCEIEGCMEEPVCGGSWGDLYLSLCSLHYMDRELGNPRPAVKKYALEREATRGVDGVLGSNENRTH